MSKLKREFFVRPDVVQISRELLGKFVFTRVDGDPMTGGMIVETEAYAGPQDKASHAHGNRRTARTEVMYAQGGVAYVYLCYGIHSLFNIITNKREIPHAVLIRAIEPTHGIELMRRRRKKIQTGRNLTAGPGALSQALGISCRHTGMSVTGNQIWLEETGLVIGPDRITASPRVGVGYAGTDARLPWRFRIRDSLWTSRAR